MDNSIIIIGGGLGGLFTGALLAKEGCRVTVFEKNRTVGGGLQTFVRDGELFETGMHVLGGFREGGSIYKICNYLGILDKLNLRDVDAENMDTITYLSDGMIYRIAEGRDGFIRSFAGYFPNQEENIRRYVNALYELTEEVDFFYLRTGSDALFSHSEQFLCPADEFVSRFVTDGRLRDLLCYMNPMYGGVKGHTPAYIHALINVLYINGASRFVDGSRQLADALCDVIEKHGGKVLRDTAVRRFEVRERSVLYVETSRDERYEADRYISAIHPCSLLRLMDDMALPRSYRMRLDSIPNTYSAFTVYLTLKRNSFPYINHTCYCQDDYGMVWSYGLKDDGSWPHGFMYMTPPVTNQGQYSRKLIITTPMSFDEVRQWEQTSVGRRGHAYLQWKKERAQRLIDKMQRLYPDLKDCIERIHSSSPLTIRDYYNVKDGSMYGFRKDCTNIALSQVPVYTKISNLLLTGQNINLHGICGVPLTAVNTAEAILGVNYLINKINSINKE